MRPARDAIPRGFFLATLDVRDVAFVGEDLACESQHLRVWIPPGLSRQLSLSAGLVEKLLGGQLVLNCHLRKQETTLGAPRNQQAMLANFNPGRIDCSRRRKQRNFNFKFAKIIRF